MSHATRISPETTREGADYPYRSSILNAEQLFGFAAAAYDGLWEQSAATLPTLQADFLQNWCAQFGPGAPLHVSVVWRDERLVAALPMVGTRLRGVCPAGILPTNEWSDSGDLLLDETEDIPVILDQLVGAMRKLPWSLLWLDTIRIESSRWTSLLAALDRVRLPYELSGRYEVALIQTSGDWEAEQMRWSRRHRKENGRKMRRLAERGHVEHEVLDHTTPGKLMDAMQICFQIEDRGWKGEQGTSILKVPDMEAFFRNQVETLCAQGRIEIELLRLDGSPIAFCLGMRAKGVFHSFKIGYDPKIRELSPGLILQFFQLERLFGDDSIDRIDALGELTDSHARWRPDSYHLMRLAIATGITGRAMLGANRLHRLLRRKR